MPTARGRRGTTYKVHRPRLTQTYISANGIVCAESNSPSLRGRHCSRGRAIPRGHAVYPAMRNCARIRPKAAETVAHGHQRPPRGAAPGTQGCNERIWMGGRSSLTWCARRKVARPGLARNAPKTTRKNRTRFGSAEHVRGSGLTHSGILGSGTHRA